MKFNILGILIIFLVWELLSLFVNRLFLPSPVAVINNLFALLDTPELYGDIWATFKRTIVGLSMGTIIGVIIGILLGFFRPLYKTLRLPMDFIRSIPTTALFPLFIVLFGLGDLVKIFVSAWAACLIVLVNTLYGFQNISQIRLLVGKLKKFSFRKTVCLIILPSTLSYIAAGIRVSLSFSLIVELVAEMFLGSQNGLGHRIFAASSVLAMEEVYVGILLIGFLGYVLNSLMLFLEHKIIHWSGQTS
ncbi:MAG: Binding-protein-dependent transport system inner membrane component [Candidatus Magasanikbacteria bacterium GW2011_GWC2_37_14]|uniref:Binding-protein-dependent transport system inner membrane component n=1 Tax=Candidatus Magasanikbacteria bacterium GW2011_GWC2_37_14 TaxID=1619046 RepID=A0A0G0ITW2_9BACT|nr:MAG: Binding-protein-dependent transport system inner membrane component [Candidatus Magasanikbacteria bacterium GW2011_GWC2_37_14]